MKLETYLNAYGKAYYLEGVNVMIGHWVKAQARDRQVQKFKKRLLKYIRIHDLTSGFLSSLECPVEFHVIDCDCGHKARMCPTCGGNMLPDPIAFGKYKCPNCIDFDADGLHYCAVHHCPLQIVRPGIYQCLECERQEELEKTKVVTTGEYRMKKHPGKFETLCKMAQIFDYSITANVDVNARIRKPFQKDQRDIAIPCEDDVQDFSVAMCKVYKWLVKQACELDKSFDAWYNGGWQE